MAGHGTGDSASGSGDSVSVGGASDAVSTDSASASPAHRDDKKSLNMAVFLSGGTDGTDGPTDAAGAIVDGLMLQEAQSKGLSAQEFMQNSDSYNFFQKLGRGLIVTGPTGTNVMDVALILVR
jgi:glycerate-2-kinase